MILIVISFVWLGEYILQNSGNHDTNTLDDLLLEEALQLVDLAATDDIDVSRTLWKWQNFDFNGKFQPGFLIFRFFRDQFQVE